MGNAAQELSDTFARLVELYAPSVLRVDGRRGASTALAFAPDLAITSGAGLHGEEELSVGLADGSSAPAQLVGRDHGTDLAVLRVKAPLHPVAFSDPENVKVGHLVVAIARPGRSARAGLGMVSAYATEWRTPYGSKVEHYLQPEGGTLPGVDGSLLVDVSGRALGLNTTNLLRGACITLPKATLARVVNELVSHGRVRRGFLGVGTSPASLPADLAKTVGQERALAVVALQPGGPSEKAGLQIGDVLLAIEGHPLRHPAGLHMALSEDTVGKDVTLAILRGGQKTDVKVTVGTRP